MRESSRQWWELVALLSAALLLVISAAVVNVSLGALGQSREAVARTNAILRSTNELQTALRAAENGQRRYLRTGDEAYRERYAQALRQVPVALAGLRASTQHPPQVARLGRLTGLVEAQLARLGARDRALSQAIIDADEARFGEIDSMLEQFKRHQRERLADLVSVEADRARQTTIVAAVSAFLSLFSALLGAYLIYRQRTADTIIRYSIELEQQVEERTRDLRDVNRELDAFAYTISHDLRAPLRALHGYSDALVEDYGSLLPDEGRRFAGAISAAAIRMDGLIEDILAYTRMARRDMPLTPVRLDTLFERARSDLLATAKGTRPSTSGSRSAR